MNDVGLNIGVSILAFFVLRLLTFLNQKGKNAKSKQSNQLNSPIDDSRQNENLCKFVKIYNARDILEANMLVCMLKENGLDAYTENSTNEVAGHTTVGFGMYGVDLYTKEEWGEKARQLIVESVNQK